MLNQKLHIAKIARTRKRRVDYVHKRRVLKTEFKRIIKGKGRGFSMKFPTSKKHRVSSRKLDSDRGKIYAEKEAKKAKVKVSG